MKSYKIKKLTRQYNGFNHYKWLIECGVCDETQNRHDLADWRDWCWQTWGPSRELTWAITRPPVPVWAWDTEFRHRRLYLKSDAELALFQLNFKLVRTNSTVDQKLAICYNIVIVTNKGLIWLS